MSCDIHFETPLILTLCLLCAFVVLTDAQGPQLVEGPVDTVGHVGGSVSFDCDVTTLAGGYSILWSKKSPDFKWISRDYTIYEDRFSVHADEGEPGFTLEILNLEPSDEGVYECSHEIYHQRVVLGSATLTVVMEEILPICQFVQVPIENETVVDFSCSWSPSLTNSTAKLYRGTDELKPDFSLSDRIVSRQNLQQIGQTSEYECRWQSTTTRRTTNCSFSPSAAAEIILGVDPYVNNVVETQTARFACNSPTSEDNIAYSWSLIKNGVLINLGDRQKGFMKQAMRILAVELVDDELVVECTATNINGEVTRAFGTLNVQPPTTTTTTTMTMATRFTTKSRTEITNSISFAPRDNASPQSTTIIILIVLVIVIIVLVFLVILMARSKLKRSCTTRYRRKADGHLEERGFSRGREVLYPDPNPDIIQAHSSTLPLYAMPDKFMKANTADGCARYPPKHYLPRRRSHGESALTETDFTQQTSNHINGNYPNPYEDIDIEGIEEAKRTRSKSHTVSRFNRLPNGDDAVKMSSTATAPQRTYRGMKAANSMSALYDKPGKPSRNQLRDVSPLNRKSWDLPGSFENLCNLESVDKRSLKSFTASICERDGYACVVDDYDEIEGDTLTSDYMDMNPIADETAMTILSDVDMTQESSSSNKNDEMPVYAQIKR